MFISTRNPIDVDSVKAHLYGDAVVHFLNKDFYPFTNQLVFVDEERELWHYSTLQELLGLDHNANRCEKGYLMGKSQFRFAFNLPHDLATSFHCPGSPVVVKYTVTVTLNLEMDVLLRHEHALTVVVPQMVAPPIGSQKVVHSRCFQLPKCRSVFLECVLDRVVLSSIGRLQASLTVTNRWKQSIKYVHMNIEKKIEAVGCLHGDQSLTETTTVLLDTKGVGLPPSKRKIAVGETYSFSPSFNVPALPPNAEVPGLLRISYLLNVSVGRAHNFVIASLKVPLTIVTDIIDLEQAITAVQPEDLLIDLTPSAWATTTTAPTIDLLA